MKIKEICRKTGLTEKAVRYYVDNGLCSPREYESRERRYLDFTEENLAELRDTAVMRKLGFSIDDIRLMKTDGGKISEVMGRYIRGLSEELEVKNRIYSSLSPKDWSEPKTLGELVPAISEVLKPDLAEPDFSKFEDGIFGKDAEEELSDVSVRTALAKIGGKFITYATIIGTIMAITTLPGIIMLVIAALIFRKTRADYITMYELLSGIGFVANMIAFLHGMSGIGGMARILEVIAGSAPDFAVMQCRLHLLVALAELAALLMLIFGKDIREHF